MFGRSLDLIDECGITYLHVFPFSPRQGTPAARMPQVAREIVRERARLLRRKGDAGLERHLAREVGSRRAVLVESKGRGRTEQFAQVALDTAVEPGTIVAVTIAGHDGRQLFGTRSPDGAARPLVGGGF